MFQRMSLFKKDMMIAGRLNEEQFTVGVVDDLDDAVIGEYLASQLGDLVECDPDTQAVPREWPKGRGSKLLSQTLYVQHRH